MFNYRHLLWLFFLPLPLFAEQCAIDRLASYSSLGGNPLDKTVHVQADNSEGDYTRADFDGSVSFQQGDKHLLAPHVTYHHQEGKAELNDGGIFATSRMVIGGIKGHYDSEQETATFEEAEYYIAGKKQAAVGSARQARFNWQENKDDFSDISWTTCGRKNPIWYLKAKTLQLNHNDQQATLKNVTLNVKDVPIFYLPYFTLPLTKARQSGFLVPSAATSEERGLELSIPYYWNIAPNQDATFTFHPMSKRGLMFEGEYRFLDKKQTGEVYLSVLLDDWHNSKDWRWSGRFLHQYQFNSDWHSDIRLQSVSDVDYARDFQTMFDTYDDWFLERHATLHGKINENSQLMLRFQDYQRIDSSVPEEQIPYARLPQLTYHFAEEKKGFQYSLDGEAVRFHEKHKGNANRYSIDLGVSRRFGLSFGYIEPNISLNAAYYQLEDWEGLAADSPKTIQRILPTLSVDHKLILERDIQWQGQSWTQTFEPRLFYLYTPYRDQSDIPIFDTDDLSLSWSSLFARNRFSGEDRIGDANQLTTAFTTSLYNNKDGLEKMRFSLGQVQYFQPHRVSLAGYQQSEKTRSMLVSEGALNIDRHWQVNGLTFWGSEDFHKERAILNLQYHLDDDRFVQLGHHYHKNDDDQYSLSGIWRLNPTWRTFFREDYSARYNRSFNTVLGLEYNDCCWAWRLAGRHYREKPNSDDVHNLLYLEFVLKGLGNMGSRSGQMLKKEIHGFKPLIEEKSF